MRDGLALVVAARQLAADERVRALDLVRDRLADVMEQGGARGGPRVAAELGRQHRPEVRALDRVGKHVLAVARAVVQPPEELRQLGVQRADVRLQHGLLADLDDPVLDLRPRLVVRLFDPRRVDPPVLEQPLERQPCDLAAYAVEAGENHRSWGVIDDEVDPGEHLERSDVAPLAADDAPLEVVGLEAHHRDRRLRRLCPGEPLHAGGEDVPRATVGLAARLFLDLVHELGAVVAQLVLELLQQDLARLPRAQARYALELTDLLALGGLELLRLGIQVARAVLQRALAATRFLQAHLEGLLFGDQAFLDARDLRSPPPPPRGGLLPKAPPP